MKDDETDLGSAINTSGGKGTWSAKDKWTCAAAPKGSFYVVGANDPQECSWPTCGCDPYANKVIDALGECGLLEGLRVVKEKAP